MLQVVGIAVLVVGLLISIGLHELGHMIPAKRFGVRVSEYFVGFGPTLWSRRGKETEYGVKAIPLGGYVRLVGMIPPQEAVRPVRGTGRIARLISDTRASSVDEIHEGEDNRAFYHLVWWRKVIVMMGGPLVNLVLAAVLFTTVLVGIGTPGVSLTVGAVAECIPQPGQECAPGDPASPAQLAGLQAGDTVVAVDGTPVATWEELTTIVGASAGQTLSVDILRDGQPLTLALTPAEATRNVYDDNGDPVLDAAGNPVTEQVGYMGVYSQLELQRQAPGAGLALTWDYLTQTVAVVANLPSEVYHVTRAALGLEERDTSSIIGVVGVGRIAGDVAAANVQGYGLTEKVADMLMLLGGLNLALFVFNMIPLVPLDGGHVASALWQAVKNGWAKVRHAPRPAPVDVARMMPLAYGVFGILLAMGLVLIYADIVAPVTFG